MKIYTKVAMVWERQQYVIVDVESFDYRGPVALLCGATGEQKSIFAGQKALFQTIGDQAKSLFGSASTVFSDLYNTFMPTVEAGPNQHGYDSATRAELNSGVTERTAQGAEKVSKAMNEKMAAAGGGNVYVPQGAKDQLQQEALTGAANEESAERMKITQDDFAIGRENYQFAAKGLQSATNVFDPATQMDSADVTAGKGAADTADSMAQAGNAWMGAVGGALGAIGGAATGAFVTKHG